MKVPYTVFSTAIIVFGVFLAFRSLTFATNRWTYDDNRVLPFACASVAAITGGVYLRVRKRK